MGYSMNEHNEVYNSEETFDALAKDLNTQGAVVVHWIDQHGTLHNVLFAYPRWVGGSKDSFPLFVAVWGKGAYTFTASVEPIYLREKLRIYGASTETQLCKLINAVLERR